MTGTIIIKMLLMTEGLGLMNQGARPVFSVAGPGSTSPGAAGLRTAPGARLTTGTRAAGSALSAAFQVSEPGKPSSQLQASWKAEAKDILLWRLRAQPHATSSMSLP